MSDAFAADDAADGAHSNAIWLPKTPKAPKSATHFMTKMPNILRLVPYAYTKQSIEEEMLTPFDEMLYRNHVRWRCVLKRVRVGRPTPPLYRATHSCMCVYSYKRDDNGRVLVDPATGRPLRESNTKLVQWEDGSLTMFVGKESLNLTRQKIANSFLFVNEVRATDVPSPSLQAL